ncbi:hypothetical protein [Paenibacillus sinensis]|uniref:hypothetical protein n=1 Tax=Paenibacillus TaxID=44249 RepID=UPI0038996752
MINNKKLRNEADENGKSDCYWSGWRDGISGREIVRIAQQASGQVNPVIPLEKSGLSLKGMGVPVMKGVVEMPYLTEEPLTLSGEKYKRFIGPITMTTFQKGITSTILSLQESKAALA